MPCYALTTLPAVRSQNKLFIPHPGPQAAGPNSQRLPRGPEPAGDLHASPKESNPRRLACSRLICPPLFEPQTEVSLISQPYGRRPMQVSSGGKTSRGRRRRPQQSHVRTNAAPRATTTTCREDDNVVRGVQAEEAKGKVPFPRHLSQQSLQRKLCPEVGLGNNKPPHFFFF